MPKGKLLAVTVTFLVTWLASCGAQDREGPPPAPKPQRCRSLDALAPALMDSLKGGQSEKLREVIERERLFDDKADGSPSPVKTLLRVSIATLSSMAADPPELGAAEGQLCNEANPPASRDSNRMCEARRILRVFVREGRGIEALQLLDPLVARVLGYLVGASGGEPHYEVAAVLATSCTKPYCRTEDTLDMAVGILSFLEPTVEQPRRTFEVLQALTELVQDPAMGSLSKSVREQMGEDGFVAFANLLRDNLMELPDDPEGFERKYHMDIEVRINDLLTRTLGITREGFPELRAKLDKALGAHEGDEVLLPHGSQRPVLMDLLDPARPEPVLVPLQKQLDCLRKTDLSSALPHLLYALSFGEAALKLSEILASVTRLAELDERVSLLTFFKRTLVMIRLDEEGTSAARELCSRALDTGLPAEGGLSNAELVMPVLADMFAGGVLGEVVCVIDSLLFGCASGPQPACAVRVTHP
ncbi:MAG: hypothetical protein HY901_24625 [Deltaproteobacteria bacterium]|nr:hypothetical protein [Deltaproteobacteria bacterium]